MHPAGPPPETLAPAPDPGGLRPAGPGVRPVGIAGAGQLARMTAEAASALGLSVALLAERADDAAVDACAEVLIGSAGSRADLERLAARCAVMTFDHEQVDLAAVADLERRGHAVRPGHGTLEVAVDKATMRTQLARAGIPVPAFSLLGSPEGPSGGPGAPPPAPPGGGAAQGPQEGGVDPVAGAVEEFASRHGWPVVLKAARGGYDGRGVWVVGDAREAGEVARAARDARLSLVLEEWVPIDQELAVVLARGPRGSVRAWPVVQTTQVGGVCREVLAPAPVPPALAREAQSIAEEVARVVGAVGVLAVEMFARGTQILVNEIAARPHNSGHWTIEGAATSQFENHLRAVLDLPLGATALRAPHVASVNVFGPPDGSDPRDRLGDALAVEGASVHLYGKNPRPGRKLGHVTVCGEDFDDTRARAWAAAQALGTVAP